jgi:ATP-binding cassette subfamily B protein
VLNKGEIVETGTHNELTAKQGYYYTLIKNQLELGN